MLSWKAGKRTFPKPDGTAEWKVPVKRQEVIKDEKNMFVMYVVTSMTKRQEIRITGSSRAQNGKMCRKISSARFAE